MPVPTTKGIPRSPLYGGLKRRVSTKRARSQLIAGLAIVLVVSVFLSIHGTQEVLEKHEDLQSEKSIPLVAEVPIRKVEAKPLEHEESFFATIKSCMPETNPKCKIFIPEHTTTERVALLAPPGDMSNAFFRLLNVVVERAKKKNSAVDMQVIPTTHMAPYGYGKTQ